MNVLRYLKRVLIVTKFTVQEAGWFGRRNAELLTSVDRFKVFLTSGQNLRYPQNLAERTIAVIDCRKYALGA